MTVGRLASDPAEARETFRELRELSAALRARRPELGARPVDGHDRRLRARRRRGRDDRPGRTRPLRRTAARAWRWRGRTHALTRESPGHAGPARRPGGRPHGSAASVTTGRLATPPDARVRRRGPFDPAGAVSEAEVRFAVRLTPRAVVDRVDGVLDGVLKARVTAPAVGGRRQPRDRAPAGRRAGRAADRRCGSSPARRRDRSSSWSSGSRALGDRCPLAGPAGMIGRSRRAPGAAPRSSGAIGSVG